MSVRSSTSFPLLAAAAALALAAGAARAQPPASAEGQLTASDLPDLGDPMPPAAAPAPPPRVRASALGGERLMVARMDLNTPVSRLCADPRAKAVLDTDLPGLTTRPEFPFFKSMSLNTLKRMSRGQMSDADLAKVQAELAALDAASAAEASK